jgi:hypothetical protein
MRFEVDEEELVDFITLRYDGDLAEKIFRNFEAFRQTFEEEVKILEDDFLEILEFCVHEAIEKMNERLNES